MIKITKPIVLIGISIAIVVVLFFMKLQTSEKQLPPPSSLSTETTNSFNLDSFELKIVETLNQDLKNDYQKNIKILKTSSNDSDKLSALDMIGSMWNSQNKFGLAGKYAEKIAVMMPTYKNWFYTANSYYAGGAYANNPQEAQAFATLSVQAARKAVKLGPDSLEAINLLGECLIMENAPVNGQPEYIRLFMEVIRKDSNNLQANYNLGKLAIQSGQLEKAQARFEKLIRLYPQMPDNYSYLGEVYQQLGKNKEAVVQYQKCLSLIKPDSETAKELKQRIKEITNK